MAQDSAPGVDLTGRAKHIDVDALAFAVLAGLEVLFAVVQGILNWAGLAHVIDLVVPLQPVVYLVAGVAGLPLIVLARLVPLLIQGAETWAISADLVAVVLAATLPCLCLSKMFRLNIDLAGLTRAHLVALLSTSAVTYWSASVLLQKLASHPDIHPFSTLLAPAAGCLLLFLVASSAAKMTLRRA